MISTKRTIGEIIQDSLPAHAALKLKSEDYETLKINQKRLGMILKGKIEPTRLELHAIAEHFKLKITDLL